MLDLSRVWEYAVLGSTIGVVLGIVFYFLGVMSGIGFRWFEEMVGGDKGD